MGTWGPKIYENDLSQDIRDYYEELLENEESTENIIDKLCTQFNEEVTDADESFIFWTTLADILLEHGNLTDFVKEKALKEIEYGHDLEIWEKEAREEEYIERKKELEELKVRLNTNKIPEKKENSKQQKNKDFIWNVGDVYAHKIKNPQYEGQYLILRKVEDIKYKYYKKSAIIYVQITKNKNLPKSLEELNQLEYIVISNEGNVRHQYRMILNDISKKSISDLIYIGNFINVDMPKDEYIQKIVYSDSCPFNMWKHSLKDIEFLINKMERLGTNIKPIYYEVNPRDISDSHIRFLMRVQYYKNALNIYPPKEAIVKNDPLLWIAFVDSLMIGGFVDNPVGIVNEEIKQETYKRINILKDMINSTNSDKKAEKIAILDELEEKVKNYKGRKNDL